MGRVGAKCEAVFRKDHAQAANRSAMTTFLISSRFTLTSPTTLR
jgi:hypothetical protein